MDKYTFNKTLCMVVYEKKRLENCSLHVEVNRNTKTCRSDVQKLIFQKKKDMCTICCFDFRQVACWAGHKLPV